MHALHAALLAACLACLIQAVPRPQEEEKEAEVEDPEVAANEDDSHGDDEEEIVGASKWDYPLGLLQPNEEDMVDEESAVFFDELETLVAGTPNSYSSLSKGLISSAKDQGQNCGSCAAFAATTAIEACYAKLAGRPPNFSEQQFIDCARGYELAKGCEGAPIHAYLKWASQGKRLAGGQQYPYKSRPASCPSRLASLDPGFAITSTYYTYTGSETVLKTLVYERAAVVVGIWFNARSFAAFKAYTSGVFTGCTRGGRVVGGHAMVAVGYGTERGKDYWLLKNSWGPRWGEKGYIKLARDVGACDIGKAMAAISCARVKNRVLDCEEGADDCEEGGEEREVDGELEESDEIQQATVLINR